MKLSEMRDLLSQRQIQLTKSLGQNFLHDRNQVERIVALAELSSSDQVLEIGPGLGPLTEALLNSGADVLAIEKDKRLCDVLEERFGALDNFQLIQADALEYFRQNKEDWSAWKLVSNLPYSVGSAILVELVLSPKCPERLVTTLQLEVVQRIEADADSEHYGQLSLFLQLRYEPKEWFKIPAGSFFPPPDVDSGCILLCRRETELLPFKLVPVFVKIVKRAFSERRKMMMKLLRHDWTPGKLSDLFRQLGIPAEARAETVALEQFVELAKRLAD
jgi:16S rRNA (adenine1518-N6/adenine1519-N6)-dimethyltransferase